MFRDMVWSDGPVEVRGVVDTSEPSRRQIELAPRERSSEHFAGFLRGIVGYSLTRDMQPCSARGQDDGQVSAEAV